MKKTIFMLSLLILSGCAVMTYEAPDGTKVTYTRLFTSSDTIKGKVGESIVEASGQKTIDPASLQTIISILGAK